MNKDDYIKSVTSKIKNKRNRAIVEREIKDHIDDETEFYQSKGYDYDTACEKAVKSMGNSEIVGAQLGKLHSGYTDKIVALVLFVIYTIVYFLSLIPMLFYGYAFNLLSVIFELFVFSAFVLSVLLANKYKSRLILSVSLLFTVLYFVYKLFDYVILFPYTFSPLFSADCFVLTFDLNGFNAIRNEFALPSSIFLSLISLVFYVGWILVYVFSYINISKFLKCRYDLKSIDKENKFNAIIILVLIIQLFSVLILIYASAPAEVDDLLGDASPYYESVMVMESEDVCDLENFYKEVYYQNYDITPILNVEFDFTYKYAENEYCNEKFEDNYELIREFKEYGKGLSYESYTLFGRYNSDKKYVAVVPIHYDWAGRRIPNFEKSQWYEVSETSEITGRLDNDDLESYYYKIEIVD